MNQTNTKDQYVRKARVKLWLTGRIFRVEKYFNSEEVQKKVLEAKTNCNEKMNLVIKEASKISSVFERAVGAQVVLDQISDFSDSVHDMYIATYAMKANFTDEDRVNCAITGTHFSYLNGLLRFLFKEYEPEGLSEQKIRFIRAMTGGYALPPEINEMVPELFNLDENAIPTIMMELKISLD